MNGLAAPALFDHVAKLVEHLITVEQFAPLGLSGTTLKFRLQMLEGFLALALLAFKQTKGVAHNLTRSLVAPGLDAALEEGIEFRCERDVDGSAVGGHTQT